MLQHKKYYKKNNKYSNFLEKQDPNSYSKYVGFIKKYLKKYGIFLDVGCGTGFVLEQLKRSNINAVGIEVSDTSISKCKKKKLNAVFYDGTKIPFKSQHFDIVGSFNVLEHTDFPTAFLEEQNRVLKKGGYLIISCPNFLSVTNSYHWYTSGFFNKIKNLSKIIIKLFLPNYNFEKMKIIVRKNFQVDDDACNVTNPIDIIKWAKKRKLKIVYWSSQEQYVGGLKDILDRNFLRNFLGAVFIVFYKI